MEKTSSLKKAPLKKTLRVLDTIKTSPFMVPTTTRKEAPTGNAPMGAIPLKAVTNCFPQLGGNQTQEASGVVFDRTQGDEGMKTPPPNDSFQASISPPVGGRLRSFRRDWLTNKCSDNVLNIITNGYVLPFISKPNLVRAPLIQSGYKALQKELGLTSCIQSLLSKNAIERVENVKSLRFYSRLFLVDLSRLNTFLLVERFKMSIRASREMGVVNRLRRCLPSHPHPPKLKEVPKVLPQVTSVSVHLPSLRTSHGPSGLYNDGKRGEADSPVKGNQTSSVPGRLADQGPISGRSINKRSESGGPNSILRVDNKSVRTKPTQVLSFVGYEYHLDSALVKPTQERWI